MDDMTDGITFERVTRTDLDDIVGLAQAAWYSPDGLGDLAAGTLDEAGLDGDEREVAARLLATDEVASYLAESTWGMKALLDGQVVGIILTQGTHASAETSAYWEGVGQRAREAAERLLAQAREREERATEPSEPVYLDEARATDEMRAEAGLANQPRVLLLVVGEAAAATALGVGCLHGPETTSRATAPSATGSSRTRTATGPSTSTLGSSDSPSAPAPSRTRPSATSSMAGAPRGARRRIYQEKAPPLGPKPELCTSTGSLFRKRRVDITPHRTATSMFAA